ncbi:MAG: RidA family protein [Dehalococcoidia bacterium]|nr:RidA family protein [Dehalococcoidia bacterium]
MQKQFINPDSLSKPTGYTHVVKAESLVFIAGQVGADRNGNVAAGDVIAQARQVLANLESAVRAAGGAKGDILSITMYVVDSVSREQMPALRTLRSEFFGDRPPVSTLVFVSGLARPELLIEIG